MISVLILTRNEEQDLPGCLDSVAWSDDIHVFDSFSTDRTAEIARAAGAHVTQRAFDGYASQRNAALRTLPFRHEWLLMLDADERPTPALVQELRRAVEQPVAGVNAYRIPIAYFFLDGSRLRHAQTTRLFLRLVRSRMVYYEREINEVLKVEGETGDLKNEIDHFPFSKGLDHWVQKHNVYSTMEAELIASGQFLESASLKTALFGRTFHERRVARKALFYRMPARPLIKWLYMMFVQGAILDGVPGIRYANLLTVYEYLIVLKTRELVRSRTVAGEERATP
jgi:glycosyltransferase involved in cell wall biosynthesis